MKTNKIFTSILTLSMVIFGAASGVSNTFDNATGDNLKKSGTTNTSGRNSEISLSDVSADQANDFSYLRFDVNKYVNKSEVVVESYISLDYLRFDVNNFTESNTDNMSELPVNDFGYLRFDVNNFTESNTDNMTELPVNEFDYLRFDVSNFASNENSLIGELPINE